MGDLVDDDLGLVDLDVVAGVVDRHQVCSGRQRHPVLLALVPRFGQACHFPCSQASGQLAFCRRDDGHWQRGERDNAGHFGEGVGDVEVLAVSRREEGAGAGADHRRGGLGAVVGDCAEGGRPCGRGGVDEDESGDLVGEQ